jgi:hypothetical protein
LICRVIRERIIEKRANGGHSLWETGDQKLTIFKIAVMLIERIRFLNLKWTDPLQNMETGLRIQEYGSENMTVGFGTDDAAF